MQDEFNRKKSSLEEQQLALQLSPANQFPVQDVRVNHQTHHQCTMQDGWYVEKKHYFIIFLSIANHDRLCLHIERERDVPPVVCCTVYSSHLLATMTTTSEWVHSNKKNTMGPCWKVQTVHFLILNTSLEFHQICPWLEDWISHCYWRLGCWIIQVQSFQMASFLWTSFWCQYQKATGCILHWSL